MMDKQRRADFDAADPGRTITGANDTGAVAQQINQAAAGYALVCQLDFGYTPNEDDVREEITRRLADRGILA